MDVTDPPCLCTGASADPTGGETAHDWNGTAGGANRRLPGALQRPECLAVQAGACIRLGSRTGFLR